MYLQFPLPEIQPTTDHKPSSIDIEGASQVAQWVKNPPTMQETQEMWVRSLGWEDPLEREMATHSSFFAWKIPQTEESGWLQLTGSQRVGKTERLSRGIGIEKNPSISGSRQSKPLTVQGATLLNHIYSEGSFYGVPVDLLEGIFRRRNLQAIEDWLEGWR